MSGGQSPTVRRRRLASELRRLREAAGLTGDEVAGRLECSASKISRVETGRVSASPRDVRDLLKIYGVTGELRDSLMQLARDSRQRGWWHAYRDSVQPHLATYLGLESAASEIRIYRVNRMPGLLQTKDYAHAIFSAVTPGAAHPGASRSVDLLMERQRQAQVSPPRVRVVMDEAALRRQVGGPDVMRGQIRRLIEMSGQPEMFIQVLPYSGGALVAMDLPFAILAFPDAADTDVVCMGYPTGALWIEDPAEVQRYNEMFRHMQAAALPPADSVQLMISVLDGM